MSDYDKGYIKWFLLVMAISFGSGLIIKAIVMSTQAYEDGNMGITAIADFIVPALVIGSVFVMLGIYNRNKQSAFDENYEEELSSIRSKEEADDDMVLNFGQDDKAGITGKAENKNGGNDKQSGEQDV